ncbi:pantoate--beta-alanine ligase [Methylothermus subterraneus]
MHYLTSIADLRALLGSWQSQRERVALVPTMGNLHAGHLSLVEEAKRRAERVVVSLFVNPLQFGPQEDYARYPRTPEEDRRKLAALGVDAVFSPTVEEMYPRGLEPSTCVTVPELADILCGAFRPGHFRGVTTVVAKLFNLVQPDVALFGEKDYQQLLIIKRMVEDLNFPVAIASVPTVREADGLALSSRNGYLSPAERAQAPELYRALCEARAQIQAGERDFAALGERQKMKLQRAGFKPEYFVVRRARDLAKAHPDERPLRILAAAWLGSTRLIDNVEVA